MREIVLDRYDQRKEVAEALGISVLEVKALVRLVRGPTTMRELAEELAIDRPYATLVVDDFESRALVARSVHPDDHRRKIVTVTKQGKVAADTAVRRIKEPPVVVLSLSGEDLVRLDEILARLAVQ